PVARQADRKAIVSRLDIGRQLGGQRGVIEVGMEVGQDRPLGVKALDPAERVGDREVAWMREVAQRIEDPHVEVFEQPYAARIDIAEIARISEPAEPEAERWNIAVLLGNRYGHDRAALPVNGDRPIGLEAMLGDDRRILAAGR